MPYKVIYPFKDLEDNNYIYKINDKFPFDDKEISKKRIKELSSTKNKIGKRLIEEIEDEANENIEK